MFGVVSHNDVGSRIAGQLGGAIVAVVGHNQHSITRGERRHDRAQSILDYHLFVMGGNQHGHARPRPLRIRFNIG